MSPFTHRLVNRSTVISDDTGDVEMAAPSTAGNTTLVQVSYGEAGAEEVIDVSSPSQSSPPPLATTNTPQSPGALSHNGGVLSEYSTPVSTVDGTVASVQDTGSEKAIDEPAEDVGRLPVEERVADIQALDPAQDVTEPNDAPNSSAEAPNISLHHVSAMKANAMQVHDAHRLKGLMNLGFVHKRQNQEHWIGTTIGHCRRMRSCTYQRWCQTHRGWQEIWFARTMIVVTLVSYEE